MSEYFSPATIDFLWALRFNNNREWFRPHKQEYEDTLYRPMLRLADSVRTKFLPEGTILKTSRIYQDVRFSHGVPYKEHLWLCIRPADGYWSEHASMYFQIEPEGGRCGFGFYAPSAALLQLHRNDMLAHPEKFPKLMKDLTDASFEDQSEFYKKQKPGSRPELEPWFQMKRVFVDRKIEVGEELFSDDLPEILANYFKELEPMYRYFRGLEAALAETHS